MRRKQATPEVNLHKSLTIPVRTRTPIEAFKMLRAGQPVDQALAYYTDQNGADKDLFLMDKVEKLHAIRKYKAEAEYAKKQYQSDYAEYQSAQAANKAKADAEAEKQRNQIISEYLKSEKHEAQKQSA